MKIFDLALLDITLIILPIMTYLLYTAYIKSINKKENHLIFGLLILTQEYCTFKYGISIDKNLPLIIINIPLLIAYSKSDRVLITIISIITASYYYFWYNNYLIFIIFEYLIYILLFYKIKKENIMIITFTILKLISMLILTKEITISIFIDTVLLYLISTFAIFLLKKAEGMLALHMNIKEINKEKQIRETLFQITHEIKNPIAVCKGYLDMYDEHKIEDFKKYVPILKEEIDRTLVLLEDFLAMNKKKINKDIIDINLLLEEIIDNMNMLFKNNNIKLTSNIIDDEIFINADYNRLTQVFINILKNSIEALENRENAEIKLWTTQDDDNITIYIKDNGVGIDKETLEKIKEPFYTTKLRGTGLGVSLSDEIISAHNGTLTYESEKEKYTLVKVNLPLEKAI